MHPMLIIETRSRFRQPPTELAKVDPSVSVLCDVHNTLVNTVLRKYATDYLKDKYLPQLSSDKVRFLRLSTQFLVNSADILLYSTNSLDLSVSPSPLQDPTPSP